MKKLLFILLLFPVISFSQITDYDIVTSSNDSIFHTKTKQKAFTFEQIGATVDNYEIPFIRYCAKRQYEARRNAYMLAGTAIVVSSLPLLTNEEKYNFVAEYDDFIKGTTIISGTLALLSTIVFIDSEKWLKYSSIKPSTTGLGVAITF